MYLPIYMCEYKYVHIYVCVYNFSFYGSFFLSSYM